MPKTDEDLIGRCYVDHRDLRMGCPVMVVTGVTDCLSVPGVWVKPRDVPERAERSAGHHVRKTVLARRRTRPGSDREVREVQTMNPTDPLVPIPNAELAPLTAWLAEALNIQGFNVIPDWRETTTWAGQASDIIIYTIYRSRTDRVGQWLCDHGIRWTHTRRESLPPAAAISWNCSRAKPRSPKRPSRCSQWRTRHELPPCDHRPHRVPRRSRGLAGSLPRHQDRPRPAGRRHQLAALPPDLATLIERTPDKTFLQGQIKLWIFPNLEDNTT